MPSLTDNLLIDTANQSAEVVKDVAWQGLKIADKSVRAIDNAVSLRSLGGVFTKHLPEHKVLDTSYGDIRSAGVEKARELHPAAGFAADILAPNVVDLAFGAGKITKGLKGIKHGISLTPDILKIARNNIDDLISPKVVATAGGPPMSLRIARNTAEQFGTANPLMIKGTKEVATDVAKSGEARRLAAKISDTTKTQKPVRTVDFSKVPQSQRRDAIANYFDEFYTKGMSDVEKYNYKEAASFGGQATEKGQKFVKSIAGTQRNILGGASHHFGLDLGLAGQTLNRSDSDEILKILNSVDVYPGNHPKNYIMAYHDYTKQIVDAQKAALIKKGMSVKDADKFLKNIPEGKMLSKAELGDLNTWQTLDELEKLKKIQGRNWKGTGVDPKKLKLPDAFIGTDHQEFIHGIGDKLPKRLELIELAKTDKWLELSPQQAAQKIAEVVREQQNVALNVNKWRLDKIKKAMKFDPAKHDWTDIQAWMIQDPRRAAHLDWHKTGAKGTGMSIEKITSDLPPNIAKEVAQVFNLEHVPQTNAKLRAFLSKTGLEQKLKINR
mgnify:CR=1 FL=1